MNDRAATQTQTAAPAIKPTPGGILQRACACGQHTAAGGECEECKKKREAGMLQRAAANNAAVGDVPPIVHDVLQSPGQPLDAATRAFMEPRFGQDFSSVRVHTSGQAAESAQAVNALAYTVGSNIVFGTGQYAPGASGGQRLLAHELTHVVQQSHSGSARPQKLSLGAPSDAAELEAEAIAERTVQTAPSPPDERATEPAAQIQPAPTSVQRFVTHAKSAQKPDHWPAGKRVRVSEDGQMAVRQDSTLGSQHFWANPSLIASATATLAKEKSVIKLKAGAATLQGPAPNGSGQRTLSRVIPENTATKTSGSGMQIWADCGKAACDIAGGGKGTGHGNRVAVFNDKAGNRAETTTQGPDRMKWQIMIIHFGPQIDAKKLKDLVGKLKKANDDLAAESDSNKKKALEGQIGLLEFQIEQVIFAPYNALSATDKDAFDKKVGINRYAAPEIGQAYTISSGGNVKPGHEDDTWNFHWAGVVMKSGSDTVTLENFSVNDPTVKNSEWLFQMYGSATKTGQTFHEQHRDISQQHGETPTTLQVETK